MQHTYIREAIVNNFSISTLEGGGTAVASGSTKCLVDVSR